MTNADADRQPAPRPIKGVSLPIIIATPASQRYSCHACGDCCRNFTVQLRGDDVVRLESQGWERELGYPVTILVRGVPHLRRTPDGACVFLQPDGLCRIHARHGLEGKPVACRFFPFSLSPSEHFTTAGLNFACRSVVASQGASPESHRVDLIKMAGAAPETGLTAPVAALQGSCRGSESELGMLTEELSAWMGAEGVPLSIRMDGLAWMAQTLSIARLDATRGDRLRDLIHLLVSHLQAELPLHPIIPASGPQLALLRQAVFARLEDPAMEMLAGKGRLRITLRQLLLSRRFRRGKGEVPVMGCAIRSGISFRAVAQVGRVSRSSDLAPISDLFSRWMQARLVGGRCFGSGYYGWSAVDGIAALVLDAACAAWLARCHCAAKGGSVPDLDDCRQSVMVVDRPAGRAPWLGGPAAMLPLRFLRGDDGLRRIIAAGF